MSVKKRQRERNKFRNDSNEHDTIQLECGKSRTETEIDFGIGAAKAWNSSVTAGRCIEQVSMRICPRQFNEWAVRLNG